MPYTLDSFAAQAPPALIAQAKAHIIAKQVYDVQDLGGEIVANVEDPDGTLHAVSVAIGPHAELLSVCDCDDEETELCRHAVALLLTAQINRSLAKPGKPADKATAGKATAGKKPAKQSNTGRLRVALEAAPHATLVELLLNLSKRDKLMQNQIMLEVADVGASLDAYRAAVKSALSPSGGVNAWYDDRKLGMVLKQLATLSGRAVQEESAGNLGTATAMQIVIMEEIGHVLPGLDYSDELEETAEGLIERVTENLPRLDAAARADTFKSLLRMAQEGTTEHELFFSVRELLADLVMTPEQRAQVEPLLVPPEPVRSYNYDPNVDPDANSFVHLRLQLIERLDGPAAAEEFARRNINYIVMRHYLLEQAAARKEWAIVGALARDGLHIAEERRYYGLTQEYHQYINQASGARGDDASDRLYFQFLTAQSLEGYTRWKASVEPTLWPTLRANLFATSTLRNRNAYAILQHEEAWDDMMTWALTHLTSIDEVGILLKDAGETLVPRFPKEMAKLCTHAIETTLDTYSVTRNQYRMIAQLYAYMQAAGLAEAAKAHAAIVRKYYHNRRALLEEIARI